MLAGAIACHAAKPTTLQIATYNVLNPVHKSVGNRREADDDELWLARGRRQAAFVADALGGADVICFQEWFFEPRWQALFEEALPAHRLCTAQRRGVHPHASPSGCVGSRRGPPAPAVRLLRRRRGAVALALALRGATRNQSNPLGAASSPTDVNRCRARSGRSIQKSGYGSGPAWGRVYDVCFHAI